MRSSCSEDKELCGSFWQTSLPELTAVHPGRHCEFQSVKRDQQVFSIFQGLVKSSSTSTVSTFSYSKETEL